MTLEDYLNKSTVLANEGKIRESLDELRAAITLAAGGAVSIKVCRQTIWHAMLLDPGWRRSWVANVACAIMDFEQALDRDQTPPGRPPFSAQQRDQLAEIIVDLTFKA